MNFPEHIEKKMKELCQRERDRYVAQGATDIEAARAVEPMESFLCLCVQNMVEDGLDWDAIEKRLM